MDETSSILNTIKRMLGSPEDYDAFDLDIIVHINSAMGRLCELGIGPSEPFMISGATETWADFNVSAPLPQVIRFIFLYVKRIFDPSANSVIMQAYQEELDKLEWTMCSVMEVGY